MDKPSVGERLLGSRKVWVAISALAAAVLAVVALPPEKVTALLIAIGSLGSAVVLAIGIEDGGKGNPPAAPPPSVNGWLLALALGLGVLVVAAGGCQPLPPPGYLQADRATYDAIATDFGTYVDRDATLTAEQRRRRHRTIDTWGFRLDQAEGRVPASSGP